MKIEWNQVDIIKRVKVSLEKAAEEGAAIVKDRAIRILQQNILKTIDSQSTGALEQTIDVKKSKFKDGGWIVGVFDENSSAWIETYGAKALFVEYGHASAGQGRSNVGSKKVIKTVPPAPFIRPALRRSKRVIVRIFNQGIIKGLK